jgi:hypothetical protein
MRSETGGQLDYGRPDLIDETLVHEHGTRPLFRVGRRQRPAADHGCTDHVEESRIDGHTFA